MVAGTVRIVSIRQRLHATPEQENVLVSHCSDARFVWNLALEQARFYRTWQGPTPNSAARSRQLTEARAQFAWLAEGSSVVQQGALRDFDQAMKNWSDGVKKRKAGLPGKVYGRPTWRRVGTHEGFVVRDLTVHQLGRKWATVLIPKVGQVRFRLTRGWADVAKATSARVTKDATGQWHVSLTCLPPVFVRTATGQSTGVDRGVANSIATCQGAMDHAPTLSKSEQVRFLALARRMSRQRKGSNRRNRTRTCLAKLHVTLGERRTDWSEKTASQLVQDFDLIAFEDLRTANMVRKPKPKPDPDRPGVFLPNGARAKAGLNKAILGSCWGQVAAMVAYKAAATAQNSAPCWFGSTRTTRPGVVTPVVTSHQETVRAKRSSNALNVATRPTLIRTPPPTSCGSASSNSSPVRYAVGQTVNGRVSHGPKPVPRQPRRPPKPRPEESPPFTTGRMSTERANVWGAAT